MRSSIFITLASAVFATATPISKRQAATAVNDTQILQFGLTLEHLESVYYEQALAKFDEAAFVAAGYAPIVRSQFVQMQAEEATHISFLSSAIGAAAVSPCTYNFTAALTSVQSFAETSLILEGVGTAAYLGAAPLITSKAILAAAGSILTVEARHSAFLNAIASFSSFPVAFETALTPNQVFNLAAPFIVECGNNFAPLPAGLAAYPSTLAISAAQAGEVLDLTYTNANASDYAVFLNTGAPMFLQVNNVSGTGAQVTIPMSLFGITYIFISSSATNLTEANTLAGVGVATYQVNL